MSLSIPPGRRVSVEVPATSANLGPGYDSLGLALDWTDTVRFETVAGAVPETEPVVRVEVSGEGAGRLPADARNLIAVSLQQGMERLGAALEQGTDLVVTVHNTIPQGRGLGSSSAAIVAGLAGAHALTVGDQAFEPADWLPLADRIEGHPDNVAAALFGGLTIAYRPATAGSAEVAAARATVHPDVVGLALVPNQPLATTTARSVLPEAVAHADAAANSGRTALLVHALTSAPDLLYEATVDWLHQSYRSAVMPESAELLESLRDKGIPAVISGAGPTVLALGTAALMADIAVTVPEGFRTVRVTAGDGVRHRVLAG